MSDYNTLVLGVWDPRVWRHSDFFLSKLVLLPVCTTSSSHFYDFVPRQYYDKRLSVAWSTLVEEMMTKLLTFGDREKLFLPSDICVNTTYSRIHTLLLLLRSLSSPCVLSQWSEGTQISYSIVFGKWIQTI